MNDPHISVLIYRLSHAASINYDTAAPLQYETADFSVTVDNLEVRFEMKAHFTTVDEARNCVEPFVRKWEFAANLKRGLGEFELIFASPVIEDLKPTPGVISVHVAESVHLSDSVTCTIGRNKYPEPPVGIAMNADVEAMAFRYSRYREGKDTLAGMAYFCLTVLEEASGNRKGIARKFGVAASVVSVLGRLTGEKGGHDARKGVGRSREFTGNERDWIEEAIKRMIWRAAEVANDPAIAQSPITMADLPTLQDAN